MALVARGLLLVVPQVLLHHVQLNASKDDQEERQNGHFNGRDPEHVGEGGHGHETGDAEADQHGVKYHGHDAEDGHRLAVVLAPRPARLEHAERVEVRVVRLVAFEGAEESEDGDGPRDAAMLRRVLEEELIGGVHEAFQFGLGDLALLVLPQLVLWRHSPVESECVEDLEDHVEQD